MPMGALAALPLPEQLALQAQWLAPARSRLLRESGIAHRQRVLDLGAGYGAVTAELTRRGDGKVVALEREFAALTHPQSTFAGAWRVCGDARELPFAARSFDLALSQCTLLWTAPLDAAVAELARVLAPGGVLLALEPDYGGLIEYPPALATRSLWLAALSRAGANPLVGRTLPGLLAAQGFNVRVRLFEVLPPPAPERFAFLEGLPLTQEERATLSSIERQARALKGPWSQIAHLPFFLITAVRD